MGLRELAAPHVDYLLIDIETPVVIVIDMVAGAHQKAADIAAEIEDFTAHPNRIAQQSVEVIELGFACRDYDAFIEGNHNLDTRNPVRLLPPIVAQSGLDGQ